LLYSLILFAIFINSQFPLVETRGNVFFSTQYLLQDAPRITTEKDAERLIFNIITNYNNKGFPFCRVYPEMVGNDAGFPRLVLTIEEGPRVRVEDLLVRSEGKTEIGAAKRLADFESGEYFSVRNTERVKKRLLATGAFEKVDETILDRDGLYYLMLALHEKESDLLMLSGSLGGDDREFGASFASSNLLGTLRKLHFDFEYQRLFSIKGKEPVLVAPAEIDAEFSIITYNSTRLISGQIKFGAPVGDYFSISLLSGFEFVNHYEDDTLTSESSDNLLGAGVGFEYVGTGWSTDHLLRVDYLFRTADRLKFAYDGSVDFMNISVKPHYRHVWTDSFDFFDNVRIGGAKDLRGYLEDEFTARRAFWINLEYHRLFIFPLVDIARIDGDIVYSYGFGISAKSRIADASLMLAWPKGGKWSDGKIHLALTREF
jgi:outer membrane protein assembly factor BamA